MGRASGGAFPDVLLAAVLDELGGTYRKSYTATGWHAQISKLTSSPRGYQAAEAAGLSVTAKTLRAWLAEEVEPTAKNRALIADAYDRMRGRWNPSIERKTFEITGDVTIASDTRARGDGGAAPFRVDGSMAGLGRWRELEARWRSGELEAEWLAHDWFQALIEDDLGEMSDPPEFDGSSYTVVIA